MKKFSIAILFSMAWISSIAQDPAQPADTTAGNPMAGGGRKLIFPGSFSFQTDQDFLFRFPFSLNEDRNYTQGTAFVYSHPRLVNFFLFYPQKLIKDVKFKDGTRWSNDWSSIGLGGTAFTPRIIDSDTPIVGDRPFAFLLYLHTSTTFQRQKRLSDTKARTTYHSFNINYGVFGTDIGYKFQGWAHEHLVKGRPTDPKGWNHQISEGGRPTILLEYGRFQNLFRYPKSTDLVDGRSIVDLGWNAGASVGYYDRLYSGLYLRLGHLRNRNQVRWNNRFSTLNGASYERTGAALTKSPTGFMKVFEGFVYGRVNGTAMFRNSMLVGQRFGSDIYTLKPSWANIGLMEFEWGGVIAFEYIKKHRKSGRMKTGPQTWALQYRAVYRTPEFNSRMDGFPTRWHYFGSASILFPFFN